MTTITTIVGFISLATSSIPPVLITGLFMSGCAALTFFMSMICLPVLLSFIPIKGRTCVSNGRNTHYAEKDIKGERAFNTFFVIRPFCRSIQRDNPFMRSRCRIVLPLGDIKTQGRI